MQLEKSSIHKSFFALCLIFLLVEGYTYRVPVLNISCVYPVTSVCLGYIILNLRKVTINSEDLFLIILGVSAGIFWIMHSLIWLEIKGFIGLRFALYFCALVVGMFIKLYLSKRDIQTGMNLIIILSFVTLVTQFLLSKMNVYWTFNIPLSNTNHDATLTELIEAKIMRLESNRYFSFFSEPSKIGFLYGLNLQICRSRFRKVILILGILISSSGIGLALLTLYIISKFRFTVRRLILLGISIFLLTVTSEFWIQTFQLDYGVLHKITPRLINPWLVFLSLPLACKYLGLGFGNIAVYDSIYGIDTSDLLLSFFARSELYYSNTIVTILLSMGLVGLLCVVLVLILYGRKNIRILRLLSSIVLTCIFSSLFLLPEMVFLSLLLWIKRTP